ncbi:hypothetical protein KIPB_007916 [Kipferlia bialata]|uniref:Uncharacterized protein n=1 Tax=Kipferlia bialata TaxID=797122 RepID=A0A9K3D224_9EUKA|nr:hypothetical protein KIPB_007916 [Kipferlia bialata]|eukprot:g7916.t1
MSNAYRKIERFLSDGPEAKRVKALQAFVRDSTPEEQRRVYQLHYETIFHLLTSHINALHRLKVERGVRHTTSETIALLPMLGLLFTHNRERMAKRWGARALRSLLCTLLSPSRKAKLRTASFKLLLMYVDALGPLSVAAERDNGPSVSILLHALGLDRDVVGPLGTGTPASSEALEERTVSKPVLEKDGGDGGGLGVRGDRETERQREREREREGRW